MGQGGLVVESLYRQIAQDIRGKIQAGALVAGQQLPTELELREKYGDSCNNIRDALKGLATNALVETKPGQGTFVVDPITPFVTTLSPDPETGLAGGDGDAALSEVRRRGRKPFASTPRVELQAASGNVAARLRIP